MAGSVTALAALNRARAAWEATQPQLTLTGWADMLDGLEGDDVARAHEQGCGVVSLESAHAASPFTAGGLVSTCEGHGANLVRVARRAQKGA